MTSNREGFEQLADALDIFLQWKAEGRPGDTQSMLTQHADKRELLECLIAEDLDDSKSSEQATEQATGQATDQATEQATDEHIIGEFRIIREIGRGGMGVVFEAEQITLQRHVALKVLPLHVTVHPVSVSRLKAEARIVGSLKHPGIVQVLSFGSDGDEHFLAMELVKGKPLNVVLNTATNGGKRMEPKLAASIAAQIADALHHAHQHKIVHRDVKPSNILLREDGETALLTDFGIARDEGLPSMTMTGDFMGTPYYVSPEQVSARHLILDHRTDVYSLGATLFEMVTGSKVFNGDTTAKVLAQILTAETQPAHKVNASVPADLSAVISRAIEKNPDQRYVTAAAFAEDLRRFGAGEPVHARHITAIERTWRWAKRQPALAASLVTLFATLAIGLIVSTSLYSDAEASLANYTRLADGHFLDDYAAQARNDLWPARPRQVAAIQRWIDDVDPVVARLANYRQGLATLRKRALDWSYAEQEQDRTTHPRALELDEKLRIRGIYKSVCADSEAPQETIDTVAGLLAKLKVELKDLATALSTRRSYRFDNHNDQFLHDTLVTVIAKLEDFARSETGLLPSMRRRLAWAQTIEQASVGEHAAVWKETIAAISASPVYAKLILSPQTGLIPIGQDPDSGLFEFGHLRTGTIPSRDAQTGRLDIDAETGIIFVLMPRATFLMGSQNSDRKGANYDRDRNRNREGELTRETVEPFFLAKHEMTQGQWLRFSGNNPSGYKPHAFLTVAGRVITLAHPVEEVAFLDCQSTLRRLGLRLPLDQEWEYACRAGSDTIWSTGNKVESLQEHANIKDEGSRADFGIRESVTPGIDDGFSSHAPVGIYRPNGFGLHDMHGNVAEWVDLKGGTAKYRSPAERENRIARGGGHLSLAEDCRAALRIRIKMTSRVVDIGCRPARSIDGAH